MRAGIEEGIGWLTQDPRRPAIDRGVRDVGVEADLATAGPERERGRPDEHVVAMAVESGRREQEALRRGLGDALDQGLQRRLGVAVLPVEEAEVGRFATRQGQGRAILGVPLGHPGDGVRRAGQPIPPGVAAMSVGRAAEDVEHDDLAVAVEQMPEREHGVVRVRGEDDRRHDRGRYLDRPPWFQVIPPN